MFDFALCLELTNCTKILLHWHVLSHLNANFVNHYTETPLGGNFSF